MEKIRVGLMFGGRSTEYEVSLSSFSNVYENIDREKYHITVIGVTRDGQFYRYTGAAENIRRDTWSADTDNLEKLYLDPSFGGGFMTRAGKIPLDVIFPVMHGAYCEDGRLQGLLAMCGIPFVGSGVLGSAAAMDKATAKQLAACRGIPVAKYLLVRRRELLKDPEAVYEKCEETFGYPVFVKPCNAGSSVGVSKARSREELLSALSLAAKHDSRILVEETVTGAEIEVAVMGNSEPAASVCGEINPNCDFYDYETKYVSDTANFFIPARLSDEVANRVRDYAKTVYTTLGCSGLSRVDFFVEGEKMVFNEINTLPGFTAISMYPSLFQHMGMGYGEIIDRLIALALSDDRII